MNTMTVKDTHRNNGHEQNMCDTPFDFSEFVESHRETMNYLFKFGSPADQAKVSILFELAGVEM